MSFFHMLENSVNKMKLFFEKNKSIGPIFFLLFFLNVYIKVSPYSLHSQHSVVSVMMTDDET